MSPGDIDKWKKMSFAEQMANIGSEVFRAGNWFKKTKKTILKRHLKKR